jgi:molecular chaperone GrpE
MRDHDTSPSVIEGEEPHADTHGDAPPLTPTPEELGIELPDGVEEQRDELLRLLADARHEANAERDHALRAVAEMDNIRKRSLRDAAEVRQRATEGLVNQLLAVLDSFDAGLAGEPATEAAALHAGFAGVRDQLLGVLRGVGLEVVPAVGERFDPTVHEAVSMLGDGDTVVAEMQRGYTLAGRVLRPASVVVGTAPGPEADEAG